MCTKELVKDAQFDTISAQSSLSGTTSVGVRTGAPRCDEQLELHDVEELLEEIFEQG